MEVNWEFLPIGDRLGLDKLVFCRQIFGDAKFRISRKGSQHVFEHLIIPEGSFHKNLASLFPEGFGFQLFQRSRSLLFVNG